MLLPTVKKIDPFYKWSFITADPDDNKFVECAVAANAHFIITNDKHFKVLKDIPFPTIQTITIEEFALLFKQQLEM
jgi:predicted nucleic acid-binding protein